MKVGYRWCGTVVVRNIEKNNETKLLNIKVKKQRNKGKSINTNYNEVRS